ncbi:MAG: type IV pili twitching motility protein PilT [Candidatus Omnitrophica bacterium CG1_02_49_10]|nr:MAG: type IV pili twitching motility protein PilT [Candidatus Omnitrophica bacterium CG1_02_49_10]
MNIKELLKLAVKEKASDLHISEGVPPVLRMDGELRPISSKALTSDDTKQMIYSILNDTQRVKFEENWELDMSLYIPDVSRFRVNIHVQRGNVEAAFRVISLDIRSIEELGLPPIVAKLSRRPNGLVIITGPTGTGKTTTLAAMVDLINRERSRMIITIEDPIEYQHTHKKSIVKQREVGSDTKSFSIALKHVLRQDPDVIMVGEMRDLETISTAITAAETGHLVLTTLHTPDAPQTIDRLIDIFPPYQQRQIQIQLADCLQGVISQELVPRADGKGRVIATETLIATPAVRNVIREHKTEQIATLIQTGQKYGMKSMDKSLKELVKYGIIEVEEALMRVRSGEDFDKL